MYKIFDFSSAAFPSSAEVYSKVVDEDKKRAYPIVSQKPKIPQGREKGHARERIYPI